MLYYAVGPLTLAPNLLSASVVLLLVAEGELHEIDGVPAGQLLLLDAGAGQEVAQVQNLEGGVEG